MKQPQITGFILAGGHSRRMGTDKAQLAWSSGTFLSHAIKVLGTVVSRVVLVGGSQPPGPPVSILPDQFPGRGPLAGVLTALNDSKTDWNFILAVDMPLVTPALLTFIVEEQSKSSAIAVVPETAGNLQPLCATYHRVLLPEIRKAIDADELSIRRLLERLSTGIMGTADLRVLRESELIAHGFNPQLLMNVNTPEDLHRARRLALSFDV
jgi:molybdenum cofactor guanylyltransferase